MTTGELTCCRNIRWTSWPEREGQRLTRPPRSPCRPCSSGECQQPSRRRIGQICSRASQRGLEIMACVPSGQTGDRRVRFLRHQLRAVHSLYVPAPQSQRVHLRDHHHHQLHLGHSGRHCGVYRRGTIAYGPHVRADASGLQKSAPQEVPRPQARHSRNAREATPGLRPVEGD